MCVSIVHAHLEPKKSVDEDPSLYILCILVDVRTETVINLLSPARTLDVIMSTFLSMPISAVQFRSYREQELVYWMESCLIRVTSIDANNIVLGHEVEDILLTRLRFWPFWLGCQRRDRELKTCCGRGVSSWQVVALQVYGRSIGPIIAPIPPVVQYNRISSQQDLSLPSLI